MKKVRYVIGAVGVAPALGLMMPAVNAAAAVTHTAKKEGKTVSLVHSRPDPGGVRRVCGGGHSKHATKGIFEGFVFYSGTCIHETEGILGKSQTGLSMRTRLYSTGGGKNYSHFVPGSIVGGATCFFNVTNKVDHEACEALVATNNHGDVKYGPVCETL